MSQNNEPEKKKESLYEYWVRINYGTPEQRAYWEEQERRNQIRQNRFTAFMMVMMVAPSVLLLIYILSRTL